MADRSHSLHRTALAGLCVALACILSYVEGLFPLSIAVPGVKLGLANLVVIFALYRLGWRMAAVVSAVRVLLIALLFGNAASLAYSIAGAVLALTVMILLQRSRLFGLPGISVAGAVCHNIGQIGMAILLLGARQIAYYLPVLLVTGTVAGICIGILAALLLRVLPERK